MIQNGSFFKFPIFIVNAAGPNVQSRDRLKGAGPLGLSSIQRRCACLRAALNGQVAAKK
jgi:hypothetical protein